MFAAADLIVKVKEPIPEEYHRFRPGQQLFTFLINGKVSDAANWDELEPELKKAGGG